MMIVTPVGSDTKSDMPGYSIEVNEKYIGFRSIFEGEVFAANVYTESFPPRSPIENFKTELANAAYPHRQAGHYIHGLVGFDKQLWFLYILGDPDQTMGHLRVAVESTKARGLSAAGFFRERNPIEFPNNWVERNGVKLLLPYAGDNYTGIVRLNP